MQALLEVRHLTISFHTYRGLLEAIHDVSLTVNPGETVGIVGESGCGKSVTSQAAMKLLPAEATEYTSGQILWDGRDVIPLSEQKMNHLRGRDMAMIFQDPMTSLNPVLTIGTQLCEGIALHQHLGRKACQAKALELLKAVGLTSPEKRLHQYPHELSGGMRQRCLIAMALSCSPRLLFADEPTTALDVTTEAQVLDVLKRLQAELGMAVVLISHNLGVIAQMADDVAVMYCGQVVELAPARTIFSESEFSHPYTEGLMVSIPRLDTPANTRLESIPGAVPHPLNLPKGCKFAPRCKYCQQRCLEEEPEMTEVSDKQQVRCFYPRKEERRANLK